MGGERSFVAGPAETPVTAGEGWIGWWFRDAVL
jgi:hypothetical protein